MTTAESRAISADATAGASTPILVVGAGAAGMACALSAARRGAEVLLVERNAAVGGTVADALIHTIGGLFDEDGAEVNAGLATELIDRCRRADARTARRRIGRTRVLSLDPALYRRMAAAWIAEEPSIRCLTGTEVIHIEMDGVRVTHVNLQQGARQTRCHPGALVDASGDGACVRLIDPALVEPGAALAGLIALLGGAEPGVLAFPKGVALIRRIRAAVEADELPAECATLWPDSGVAEDEVYLKLNLSADTFDPARIDAVLAQLLDWLRTQPGLAQARLLQRGRLGVRDGGRIRGRVRLSEADLKAGHRFPDALCRGCWPIEHWHPQRGIQLDYLPRGTRYDIPLGALEVAGLQGVYAAGRCLSAEPRAQASARVAGTCWAMGDGLGAVLAGHGYALGLGLI